MEFPSQALHRKSKKTMKASIKTVHPDEETIQKALGTYPMKHCWSCHIYICIDEGYYIRILKDRMSENPLFVCQECFANIQEDIVKGNIIKDEETSS